MLTRRHSVPAGLIVAASLFGLAAVPVVWAADGVDFNRDVRPILSDRCFVCHGPDAQHREADLRLDTRQGLFAQLDDDLDVVRPGELEHSAIFQRITASDPDERMPPEDSKLTLTPQEIDTIRRWIEEGAVWEQHWAFAPRRGMAPPDVQDPAWCRNWIDRFVLARLESAELRPGAEASRERLLRRVTFDLTGLPPTLAEIDAFLADPQDQAYEQVVDRLLASPHFGQRMAADWLDVSRYADTYGYQSDVYRAMWPWRDWVIRALNDNLPYDQFITWQLAGDLLPGATQDQVLATAFNRHHRQTNEGGSVEEEFRVEYVADRVDTFGTAMLGLTLGCARCHDHKFDPVTQVEYYQLAAFFNNIDESGLYSHFTDAVPTPTLLLMDAAQRVRRESLERDIADVERQLAAIAAQADAAAAAWLAAGPQVAELPGLVGQFPFESLEGDRVENLARPDQPGKVLESPVLVPGRVGQAIQLSGENTISVPAGGDFTRNDAFSVALWINTPDEKERAVVLHRSRAWTDAGSRGYELLIEQGRLSASLIHFWPGNAISVRTWDKLPVGRWVHVAVTYEGSSRAQGLNIFVDGARAECEVVRDNLHKEITGGGAETLDLGQRFRDRGFKGGLVDELHVLRRCLTPIEVTQLYDGQALTRLLERRWDELDAGQRELLKQYFVEHHDADYAAARQRLRTLRDERSALIEPIPEIMVMRELPERRATYVLRRGAYDQPAAAVEPNVPDSLPPWPADQPKNRLGLARWLTDPQHPLLARVAVNRLWQSLFGQGLVTTAEDLGSQGDLPEHGALLDALANQFVESGWNVKALVRLIVTSATYRQDSKCTPALRAQDPANRLLARGPSYRLPAEMIRDQALAASGLLVDQLGGPPVKPYQPPGLWEEKARLTYERDQGAGSHRRSLYTYWKRTSPPPAMMILDTPTREVCVARRQTTATPLQALVFWNDPQYVEAARALAQRVLQQHPADPDRQLVTMFRLVTSRQPADRELAVLRQLRVEQQAHYRTYQEDATRLLEIGDHPRDGSLDPSDLAALSAVAQVLLSYDETVMKR